eukprot:809122-Prymnesium_polylepis.1
MSQRAAHGAAELVRKVVLGNGLQEASGQARPAAQGQPASAALSLQYGRIAASSLVVTCSGDASGNSKRRREA